MRTPVLTALLAVLAAGCGGVPALDAVPATPEALAAYLRATTDLPVSETATPSLGSQAPSRRQIIESSRYFGYIPTINKRSTTDELTTYDAVARSIDTTWTHYVGDIGEEVNVFAFRSDREARRGARHIRSAIWFDTLDSDVSLGYGGAYFVRGPLVVRVVSPFGSDLRQRLVEAYGRPQYETGLNRP